MTGYNSCLYMKAVDYNQISTVWVSQICDTSYDNATVLLS